MLNRDYLQAHICRSHFDQVFFVAANTRYGIDNPAEFIYTERDKGSWQTVFDGGGEENLPSVIVAMYCDGKEWFSLTQVDTWSGEEVHCYQFAVSSAFFLSSLENAAGDALDATLAVFDGEEPEVWVPVDEKKLTMNIRRMLEEGIRRVQENFGQGMDFFSPRPKERKKVSNSKKGQAICPFCGEVHPLEVMDELIFLEGCDTCESGWGAKGTLQVRCSTCRKIFYKKEISVDR